MLRVKSDKPDWLRIRNDYSAHAQEIVPFQKTKKSAASEDENDQEHSRTLRKFLRQREVINEINIYHLHSFT